MDEKKKIEIRELTKESIKLKIVGVTPLLMEKMDMSVVEFYDGKKGKKNVVKDTRTEEEKVESKAYKDSDENYVLPSHMILKCLEETAPYIEGLDKKRVKGSIRFKKPEFRLDYGSYCINRTSGKTSGMTKAPRLILRPQFNDWSCEVDIIYNSGLISAELLFNMFNIAGFNLGLGGWNPFHGGTYGQFEVTTK